jgi:hypothetical protein
MNGDLKQFDQCIKQIVRPCTIRDVYGNPVYASIHVYSAPRTCGRAADLPLRRVISAERGPNNIACEGRRT